MKKFILAFCAVMLLMLSCTALADEVRVIGYSVYDETLYFDSEYNEGLDAEDDWVVKAVPGNPVQVTLRNCDLIVDGGAESIGLEAYSPAIFADGSDVELVLEGANRIKSYREEPLIGINGNLTISGSGSLEIVQNTNAGWGEDIPFGSITVNGKLTMESGSVDVSFSEDEDNFGYKDRYIGILARDIDMLGGKMRAEGVNEGITAYGGDINVTGGEMYGEANWTGVFANNGNINVTGGRVEGYALDDADGVGIVSIYSSEAEGMSLESDSFGGLINANGMNIYSLDGGQQAGKIGTLGYDDGRQSAVFAMNEDVETGYPALHALIVAPIPATGDEANLILWVGMLVVAGFALVYMKKRYA